VLSSAQKQGLKAQMRDSLTPTRCPEVCRIPRCTADTHGARFAPRIARRRVKKGCEGVTSAYQQPKRSVYYATIEPRPLPRAGFSFLQEPQFSMTDPAHPCCQPWEPGHGPTVPAEPKLRAWASSPEAQRQGQWIEAFQLSLRPVSIARRRAYIRG